MAGLGAWLGSQAEEAQSLCSCLQDTDTPPTVPFVPENVLILINQIIDVSSSRRAQFGRNWRGGGSSPGIF